MKFKLDYYPKNHKEKLKLIRELKEHIEDVQNIDVDSCVDSDIEDRGFIKGLQKDISKPMDCATGLANGLRDYIIEDLEGDFIEKLQLYQFMVEKGIEENTFPFKDWINYLNEVEKIDKVIVGYKDVLSTISKLVKVNDTLARENFSDYLFAVKDSIKSPNDFFPALEDFVKKNYPDASLLDILAAKDLAEIEKGLDGKHVPLKEGSKLFFMYASSIPNTAWTFKDVTSNKPQKLSSRPKPQISISVSTSNFDEIFDEFSKTAIWNRINEKKEFKNKFIEQVFNEDLKYPLFWESGSGQGKTKVGHKFNWDNIVSFVKHLTKEDVDLAEDIVSRVFAKLPKYKHDQHSAQAIQVVNVALYEKLQKEMPVGNMKEKRNKI